MPDSGEYPRETIPLGKYPKSAYGVQRHAHHEAGYYHEDNPH
jgi:hypothetical protein